MHEISTAPFARASFVVAPHEIISIKPATLIPDEYLVKIASGMYCYVTAFDLGRLIPW